MGELDTDYIFEIPCLERMYFKEIDGDREMVILDHSRIVQDVDCLVDPGRVPFNARLHAVWYGHAGESETTEWPNLPSFLKRGKIELGDSDLERAKKHRECSSIALVDNATSLEVHVFYDRDGNAWDPKWEGVLSSSMRVRANWVADDGSACEEVDWDSRKWVPDWVADREGGNER